MRVNYGTRKETKVTSEKVIANFSSHHNEKISLFLFKIFRYQYSYSIYGKPCYWNTIGQLIVEWKQINGHSFSLPLMKIVKLSNQISVFQYRILYAPFVYDSIFFELPEIVEWDKLGHCVEFTIQTTENQLLYCCFCFVSKLNMLQQRCIAKHTQYCDTGFSRKCHEHYWPGIDLLSFSQNYLGFILTMSIFQIV